MPKVNHDGLVKRMRTAMDVVRDDQTVPSSVRLASLIEGQHYLNSIVEGMRGEPGVGSPLVGAPVGFDECPVGQEDESPELPVPAVSSRMSGETRAERRARKRREDAEAAEQTGEVETGGAES